MMLDIGAENQRFYFTGCQKPSAAQQRLRYEGAAVVHVCASSVMVSVASVAWSVNIPSAENLQTTGRGAVSISWNGN